ncbi:MAG: DUF58 domain-containing protein [Geobacteraceae bacterium]|nr:DUF58 domain-containing protein [Geobacteraceae bacterium]
MLGFMAISGVFGLRNLQKLRIALKFPDEIYCNTPSQLTLQLCTKRKFLPHYLLTIAIEGSEIMCHLLAPKQRQERKVTVTFDKRGIAVIRKAIVKSPFPVNFFVRSNIYMLDESCLVFPCPIPLPVGWHDDSTVDAGSLSQRRKGSSTETESIGAYTEAEPLKQIHWKLSARHDELLVKEMSAESGKPVIIELDGLPGGIEDQLGHAAFLINRLILEGRATGLRIGDKTIPPELSRSHRLKLLAELANHV